METRQRKRNKKKKAINKTKKNLPKCSPVVKGHTIHNESCLTKPILSYVALKGNKSTQDVLKKCGKNDKCILSIIPNEEERKKIADTVLSPPQPLEWKDNINEWLSDDDILNVLSQYEDAHKDFVFLGPSYIDFDYKLNTNECVENSLCKFSLPEYIKKGKTKIGIIFNLDDHTKSGSHWVSLYIDIKHKYIFYFDSAANPMPTEIDILIQRIKQQSDIKFQFHTNGMFEHQYENTECGMYSLFFIITMLTNKYEDKEFKTIRKKVDFFTRKRIPDKYVERLRNEYYNSNKNIM